MSSFLDSTKTANVVGLANLAQNMQINAGITKLQETTAQQNENIKEGNRLQARNNEITKSIANTAQDTKEAIELNIEYQKIRDLRDDIKAAEIELKRQKIAIKRDVLFGISQDLKLASEGIMDEVERFYILNGIVALLREQNIDRAHLESMQDKKMFHETEEGLQSAINKSFDEMSKEQIEDVKTINKVLSVDEEQIIEKLMPRISKHEAFRQKIKKTKKEVNSSTASKASIKKALEDIIDINDDGIESAPKTLKKSVSKEEAPALSADQIELLTKDVELNTIYEGRVAKIMDFGAFVTILPGKDGLVHISEISKERVESVNKVLTEGEIVKVKVIEIDRQKRIRLSMKAIENDKEEKTVDEESSGRN